MRCIPLAMSTCCLSAGLLFVSASVRAENEPPIAEIEVTAERMSPAEQRAPTTFLSEIDVEARDRALDTTADALAEAPGVQVQRFGGLGAFSTISIRGSSANQVPVYLDGVPLSQALDQTVDLSNLPLDSLERIEVYRGTVPVGFGGGGIGGVVNLVTKPPSAEPETELSVGYGSFTTRKVVASHTQRLGDLDVLGHVTYLGSQGNFTYFDDNGTPENPTDDGEVTRINNAFNSVGGLLRVSRDLGDGLRADATQEFFYNEQGVPGPASTQFATPSLEELRSLTYLRLSQTALAGGPVDVAGTLYGIYNLQRFDDPQGDFGFRSATRDQTALVGANNTGTWFAAWQQAVSWFGELSYEQFFPFNSFAEPPDGPDQTRLRLTLAAQDEIPLFSDRVVTVPSLRYEHLLDDFSDVDLANQPDTAPSTSNTDLWTPAIGSAVRVTDWLSLRANFGRFQRAPSFAELFGNTGTTLGNANLKPETGINRDAGFVAAAPALPWLERAAVTFAYFYNDYDDLITFTAVSPKQFRAINIGKARVQGAELSLSLAALEHFSLELNYTHQDSKDLSDDAVRRGQPLPLLPGDELFARGEIFERWGKLYYEFTYVGPNTETPSGFTTVPSRAIHTVGARLQPLDWLEITFEAANITDNQIRDLGDFPLPGLSFFGGFKVAL